MGLEERIDQLEARVCDLERKINVGSDLELLRKELSKPVERSPEEICRALKIVGMGEGPRDMAKNFRRYLYKGKQ
ncbi:MAG: hypothetical protein AB1556_10180 [Bacillota bacterium]